MSVDVALFLPSFRGGGVERYGVNIATGLAADGLRVDLVVRSAEGPYLEQVPPEVRVFDLSVSRVAGALVPLTRYLRRERPKALLSAGDSANVVAICAKRLARTPTRVVVGTHTVSMRSSSFRARWVVPAAVRWSYGRADGMLAVSQGVADHLAEVMGYPRERVQVIYNPVVTHALLSARYAKPDHRLLESEGLPVLLAIGRLRKVKNFALLLRAFARVRAERDVRLLILGEGRERAALERLAGELGIRDAVDLPGFVTNPFAYMTNAALFVLSSDREGLSNVLIEAMACGCPVVSTNCPTGPSEILEGGKHGRLTPVGDDEALARAILYTLDNPPDREHLRQRAMDFHVDLIVKQYRELLRV
jgi:glycosyltransferase involved in cell wall biosynthesis